jgi:hypothetical protein
MSRIVWACANCVAAVSLWVMGLSSAGAAGAMAVGVCAAYGYAFDFKMVEEAREAALANCKRCRLIGVMQHACGAFAIDGHNACGAHGYAVAPRLGQAENIALQYCYKYGGRDCVIRAFACDRKG